MRPAPLPRARSLDRGGRAFQSQLRRLLHARDVLGARPDWFGRLAAITAITTAVVVLIIALISLAVAQEGWSIASAPSPSGVTR